MVQQSYLCPTGEHNKQSLLCHDAQVQVYQFLPGWLTYCDVKMIKMRLILQGHNEYIPLQFTVHIKLFVMSDNIIR